MSKVRKVRQWWLLFHDVNPEKNMIMSIPHTADVLKVSKHVQQHVVSIEDYNELLDFNQKLLYVVKEIYNQACQHDEGISSLWLENMTQDILKEMGELE